MSAPAPTRATGLLAALATSLAAAAQSPDGWEPPAAILWPDPARLWRSLVPQLRRTLPALYALGDYAPGDRTGPAVWLRCLVERTLPEVSPPRDTTPILYLPGVAIQGLRAGDHCSWLLQPLIELQYRGCVWRQPKNGREWTPELFLSNVLHLDLAGDEATRAALYRSLPLLPDLGLAPLLGRRLTAADFDRLHVPDPIRDLLRWIADPAAFRAARDAAAWAAFENSCRDRFALDPTADGPEPAAANLAAARGAWEEAWQRFREAPSLYPGIPAALRNARRHAAPGQTALPFDQSRDPEANESAEAELRAALTAIGQLPPAAARQRIAALESNHAPRREWVWAAIGQSPLAQALDPLARLAEASSHPLTGASLADVISAYANESWRCDAAAWESLAKTLTVADRTALVAAVRAIYSDWLDASARRFQQLFLATPAADLRRLTPPIPAESGTCVLFADGLRLDLARKLEATLEARGLKVRFAARLAPAPTVTATSKPAVAPLPPGAIAGGEAGIGFEPVVASNGRPADARELRRELESRGAQILGEGALDFPDTAGQGGWAETGRIDHRGHDLGAELAEHLENEISRLAEKIANLLNCGWARVRVVTDHGWLLLPGGLPKVELPKYLAEPRWARCAALRPGAVPAGDAIVRAPWHWNPAITIASPPGAASFQANKEYAHGGLSLQECIVPELLVERPMPAASAKIAAAAWVRLRCRVQVQTSSSGLRVELRQNWRQPDTAVAAAKTLDPDGHASLVVADDSLEGGAAAVVVLDETGNVLDYKSTTIGGENAS